MKKKTIGKEYIFTALILFVVLAVTMVLDSQLPGYHIVIKVIKKASVYSLVAVSMNLLNGFTGLFSLGQAGFMLLGRVFLRGAVHPVAKRAGVYQYFDGGIVKFSLPEIFASFLGDKVGSAVGMILALLGRRSDRGVLRLSDRSARAASEERLPRYCDPSALPRSCAPLSNGTPSVR